jgi:hypothetical protein
MSTKPRCEVPAAANVTVTLELNPEVEHDLPMQACERSLSLESTKRKIPDLPIRHLGAVGSLLRRDIYDDVD